MANNGRPKIRSSESIHKSFISLVNTTQRNVAIYWINYESECVKYRTLRPQESTPVNTFSTHPWVFVDDDSGELMQTYNRTIFWPPKCVVRKVVEIQLPLISLKQTVLWTIFHTLRSEQDIETLELPRSLHADLRRIYKISSKNRQRQLQLFQPIE